ncbi:hypothetical protein GE09DRAFT_1190797 [Coniochaeta sp. 2T2.1]|nr:hypothetical protein GE09DRAFT_1190797 [Coniochaeta sp. 2T2.1]
MSHPRPRFRADTTRALLGDTWVAEAEEEEAPRPVKPERTTSAYTPAPLKRSLRYADQVLRYQKRKVSPIVERLLTKHAANVVALLTGEITNAQQREDLIRDIIDEERVIYTKCFLRVPYKDCWPYLIEGLSELRRYEFAARYGEDFENLCDDLQKTAVELQTVYYHAIPGWHMRWTIIAASLARDIPQWQRYAALDKSVRHEEVATHLAIAEACRAMGTNFESMLALVAMYPDRNSIIHISTMELIEQGRWDDLKHNLVRDLLDIDLVTPRNLRHTIPILQAVINAIIDRYWIRHPSNPRDQNVWNLRPQAVYLGKRLRKDREERRGNIDGREREEVAAQAAKRYRDQEDKCYKTGAVEEDEDVVVARNKRRHRDFEMLVKLADHNLICTARDYVLKYRSIKPPLLEPEFYFEEEAGRRHDRCARSI